MIKKTASLILILLIIISLAAVLIHKRSASVNLAKDKILVTTSFYPLFYFSQAIGGDKAQVINLTPAGAEPHDYEPTAQDMALIEQSRLVVINGNNFEPWGNDLRRNLTPTKNTLIAAGEGLANRQLTEQGKTMLDPHIWLSPALAMAMVDKISQGFEQADVKNRNYYQTNAQNLKRQLLELDLAYRQGLRTCRRREIITAHAAFGYLAAAYDLNQQPIAGLSPDSEPSAAQLVGLAKFAKEHKISYIFFESLVSPKLAETLAREIGAKTLVLNPLEGLKPAELTQGNNYLTEMQANLLNLKTALQCQ